MLYIQTQPFMFVYVFELPNPLWNLTPSTRQPSWIKSSIHVTTPFLAWADTTQQLT